MDIVADIDARAAKRQRAFSLLSVAVLIELSATC
jgi:hypothetical protein